jgi:structural maintenance of chromosome 3 (chondroitin sulfate proteoglycan 6)
MSNLESTNKKLVAFSHVNKNSLDQYTNFTTQREDLLTRKQELDAGRQSILDLIESLDMKKEDAILTTYKTIARHFAEVFTELVPEGTGRLVMQTEHVGEDDAKDAKESKSKKRKRKTAELVREGKAGDKKVFSGVDVKVSFTGSAQAQRTAQLSGGQKTVVALAIIFAIQRCDPSPFYLFDEIDQALDDVYRTSVASLLAKQQESTQFITTTFRNEMLVEAKQFLGVSFANKVSRVHVLTRVEAQELARVNEREHEDARDADGQGRRKKRRIAESRSRSRAGSTSRSVSRDPSMH